MSAAAFPFRGLCLAALLLASACGRSPGPDEDEYGQFFFWLVQSGVATQQSCTNDRSYQMLFPTTLSVGSSIAYYWGYVVSEDGRTAVGQDCASSNWYDCTDVPDFLFSIDGHVLTSNVPEVVESSSACTVTMNTEIRLEDQGEEMQGRETVTFRLEGEGCDDFEAAVRSRSGNGLGLRECVASRTTQAIFSHTRD